MAWSVLFIAGGVYVGLLVFMAVFQSHFIYFPDRYIAATPEAIGLQYETVHFQAADGVNLSGWFVPAEQPRGVVLFCHGNAGNMSHRLESIRLFNGLGLSTFIFDYRGYGQSEGRTTEQGTYSDAEAAWRYLVEMRQLDPAEIVVFGRSLGAAIAAWLAQQHAPAALIIESGFTSVPDLAAKLYPYFPVRLLVRFDYGTIEYVRNIDSPLLIVHSRNDEIIPFINGKRLFNAANEPKRFLEISGSHNDGFIVSGKRYENGIDAFISEFIRRPSNNR